MRPLPGRHAPIAIGLGLVLWCQAAGADDGAGRQGIAVSVAKAEQACFTEALQATGSLVPKSEVKLSPERGGLQVSQILVEPGDSVGAGQILARLVAPSGVPPQTEAIKSPVSGIVVAVSAVIGRYAAPNAAVPLFRIVDGGELEMRGDVLASLLPKLQVGQNAHLRILDFGPLAGHVVSIEPSIEPATQLGVVHIAFNPDPKLRSGIFARADIDVGRKCGIAVPLSAVMYGGEGAIVQVVRGGHIETRRVDIGLLQDGSIQILDGVDAGDLVIARAGSFLREGDLVRPIEAEPKPKP